MELQLDTPDCDQLGKDYFVSVRVAEVTKFSKLGPSRTFKFPASAVGSKRYGKVEVYRRVGQGVVCIDPTADQSDNEVCVQVEAGQEGLPDRLNFEAKVSATSGKQNKEARRRDSDPKAVAAREYLESHHLEVRLAEAMQSVLRERPADPAVFIAKELLGNGGLISRLPRTPGTAPPQGPGTDKLDSILFEIEKERKKKHEKKKLDQVPMVQHPPMRNQAKEVSLPVQTVPGWSQRPSPEVAPKWSQRPSVGTWLLRRPLANAKLGAANVLPEVAPRWSQRPSVGTWLLPRQCEKADVLVKAAPRWSQRPSVGTWLLPILCEKVDVLVDDAPRWSQRPSVGTWLLRRPDEEGCNVNENTEAL
jgi:hypothetical protein